MAREQASNIKKITLIALMIALLIICSYISIPIGTVPISLQTFAVVLIGLLLPPSWSVLVMILYMMMGLVGLPVFAGGQGGLQSLLSPSFGFVIAFIIGAPAISLYLSKRPLSYIHHLMASLIGQLLIYAVGLSYMAWILNVYLGNSFNLGAILSMGMIPFIPGDILKTILAVTIYQRLHKAVALPQ